MDQRAIDYHHDGVRMCGVAFVHHALAKVYEHNLKDFGAAHRHARYTIEIEGPLQHGRRIGRLRRKLLAAS